MLYLQCTLRAGARLSIPLTSWVLHEVFYIRGLEFAHGRRMLLDVHICCGYCVGCISRRCSWTLEMVWKLSD